MKPKKKTIFFDLFHFVSSVYKALCAEVCGKQERHCQFCMLSGKWNFHTFDRDVNKNCFSCPGRHVHMYILYIYIYIDMFAYKFTRMKQI